MNYHDDLAKFSLCEIYPVRQIGQGEINRKWMNVPQRDNLWTWHLTNLIWLVYLLLYNMLYNASRIIEEQRYKLNFKLNRHLNYKHDSRLHPLPTDSLSQIWVKKKKKREICYDLKVLHLHLWPWVLIKERYKHSWWEIWARKCQGERIYGPNKDFSLTSAMTLTINLPGIQNIKKILVWK